MEKRQLYFDAVLFGVSVRVARQDFHLREQIIAESIIDNSLVSWALPA